MKNISFLFVLILFAVNLFPQESSLKTGFYRVVENDSCSNSNNYLKIAEAGKEYCVYKKPLITDANFKAVNITADTISGSNYILGIQLDSTGAYIIKEATAKMVGQKAAFIVDGKIVAAPTVRDPITSGQIAVFCDGETLKQIKEALHLK